jgi:hypothetical protein
LHFVCRNMDKFLSLNFDRFFINKENSLDKSVKKFQKVGKNCPHEGWKTGDRNSTNGNNFFNFPIIILFLKYDVQKSFALLSFTTAPRSNSNRPLDSCLGGIT